MSEINLVTLITENGVEAWNKWREEHPFRSVNLRYANLSGAKLRDANLCNTYLSGANLSGAYLRDANLCNTSLSETNLSNANFSGANLRDTHLSNANLGGAYLTEANLCDADLSNAHLSGAYLKDAELCNANLRGADLTGANLSNANLGDADLSGADLSGANLYNVDLKGALLTGAKFVDAKLGDTVFDSKHQLNSILDPLNTDQLLRCIFENETNSSCIELDEKTPSLSIKLTRKSWRPIDIALAFTSIELMSNRLQFLCKNGIQENQLRRMLISPCFPEQQKDGIQITSIHASELQIGLSFFKDSFLLEGGAVLAGMCVILSQIPKLATARVDEKKAISNNSEVIDGTSSHLTEGSLLPSDYKIKRTSKELIENEAFI